MSYQDKILKSKLIIESVFEEFNTSNIAISFNGGKDNIVMLDLIKKTINNKYDMPMLFNVSSDDEFDELKTFCCDIMKDNNYIIKQYYGDMKKAVYKLKSDYPSIKIIFMGIRKNDIIHKNDIINSNNLPVFQVTDNNWPKYVRVYPILDMEYTEIWKYIKDNKLKYCKLYDQGYTSLGNKSKTFKNDKLMYYENGITKYKPAYDLTDEIYERTNRL